MTKWLKDTLSQASSTDTIRLWYNMKEKCISLFEFMSNQKFYIDIMYIYIFARIFPKATLSCIASTDPKHLCTQDKYSDKVWFRWPSQIREYILPFVLWLFVYWTTDAIHYLWPAMLWLVVPPTYCPHHYKVSPQCPPAEILKEQNPGARCGYQDLNRAMAYQGPPIARWDYYLKAIWQYSMWRYRGNACIVA